MWRDDTSFSLQKYSLSPQLDETYAFPTSRNLEFSDALLIFCFPTLSLLAFIAHQLLICIICYMKTCFHMPTIALADKTGCKPGKLLPQKCPTLPLVVTINTLNASRKKKRTKNENVHHPLSIQAPLSYNVHSMLGFLSLHLSWWANFKTFASLLIPVLTTSRQCEAEGLELRQDLYVLISFPGSHRGYLTWLSNPLTFSYFLFLFHQ